MATLRLAQRRRPGSWLAVGGLPATAVVVALAVVPALLLLSYAFMTGGAEEYDAAPPFTFGNVADVLGDDANLSLVRNTLIQGGAVAVLGIVLAVPIAYWIHFHAGRARPWVLLLFVCAFLQSYLVRLYAFRTILGERGIVNETLMRLGVIDDPASWLLFSRFSVIVALLHITLPITVLLLYVGFRPLDRRYLELSDDLGASAIGRWRFVVFPLIAPAAASAAILAFLIAALDYVTPSLLGGPGLATFAIKARSGFQELGNYPDGAAYAWAALLGCAFVAALLLMALRAAGLSRQEPA